MYSLFLTFYWFMQIRLVFRNSHKNSLKKLLNENNRFLEMWGTSLLIVKEKFVGYCRYVVYHLINNCFMDFIWNICLTSFATSQIMQLNHSFCSSYSSMLQHCSWIPFLFLSHILIFFWNVGHLYVVENYILLLVC